MSEGEGEPGMGFAGNRGGLASTSQDPILPSKRRTTVEQSVAVQKPREAMAVVAEADDNTLAGGIRKAVRRVSQMMTAPEGVIGGLVQRFRR